MRESLADTIVARATPAGSGAVAVVRLSGPRALAIGAAFAAGGPRQSHRLYAVALRGEGGEVLDHGMIVEMRAPRSYTGEDVVELHLHGSPAVVRAVCERCVALGARAAGPGEFTLRAFTNGRLTLAQAEAVGDLIASTSDAQRRVAAAHLGGALSSQVGALLDPLETVLADWQAALDFPEHPSGDGWRAEHAAVLRDVACKLQVMFETARVDAWRTRRVALCGAPNVGKSSLLNAWAGETRVLVDAAPGTTRDPVEIELGGWRVVDTAGLRAASGLEAAGIALSLEQIRRSDLALWLVDASSPVWPDPGLVAADVVVVGSKADLVSSGRRSQLESEAESLGFRLTSWISCRTGEGVSELRRRLSEPLDGVGTEAPVVRERHVAGLREAFEALERARGEGLLTLDVRAMELGAAVRSLGAILGRNVDDAVLDRIFAAFCIGK
jgi:tRNA modification GTPase